MDKMKMLKLLQNKMGDNSNTLSAINSSIPNVKQNEIIQGKTGLGNSLETGLQAGADALVPGLGSILGAASKVGSMVEGDGSSTGKNIAGELINPLSNLNDLAEGRAKYAIPIVGSFLKASDSKKKLEFDKLKQERNAIDQARQMGAAYPSTGITGTTRFELGGTIPISDDTQLLKGDTHQQGGIPLMQQGQQIGEAENNELLINTPTAAHIASDKVINPKTGNSFAMDIAQKKSKQSKFEDLLEKRKGDETLKTVLDKYKKETEALIQRQEEVKNQMLQEQQQMEQAVIQEMMPQQAQQGMPQQEQVQEMKQEQMPQFAMGGKNINKMPKYVLGGQNINDPRYLALMKQIEEQAYGSTSNPYTTTPVTQNTGTSTENNDTWATQGNWGTTSSTSTSTPLYTSNLDNYQLPDIGGIKAGVGVGTGKYANTYLEGLNKRGKLAEEAMQNDLANLDTELPFLDENMSKMLENERLDKERKAAKRKAKEAQEQTNGFNQMRMDLQNKYLNPASFGAEAEKLPITSINTAKTSPLLARTNETSSLLTDSTKVNNSVPADILTGFANAFDRRKDKAPQKDLLNYLAPTKVDYGNQRTEAQRQALGTRRALASSTTDATSSRASTLATLAEQIGGVNRVNEAETNVNQQLMQDILAKNSQIQDINNDTKFGNATLAQQFKDDKRAKNLQLASRIANETSQRGRDANADKLAEKQNMLAVLTQDNPKVIQAALEMGMFDGASKENLAKIKKLLATFEKEKTTTKTE